MEPESIKHHFDWSSGEASDQSLVFEFDQDFELMPRTEGLERLSIGPEEASMIAKEQFAAMEESLKQRDLNIVGLDKEALDMAMKKIMGVDEFYQKVFGVDDYETMVMCSVEDLKMVVGNQRVLIYNANGGPLFRAGPLSRKSQGEMIYSFMVESLSMGRKDDKWILLPFS